MEERGCRTGGMQDWRDAVLEGCRTGGMQEMYMRCRTRGKQDRMDKGQENAG